jgi:hypothetical protein
MERSAREFLVTLAPVSTALFHPSDGRLHFRQVGFLLLKQGFQRRDRRPGSQASMTVGLTREETQEPSQARGK